MDIIGNLPLEIVHEIFKYLGGTELSRCCHVSKVWRECANSDHLWKSICLKKGIICEPEYYNSDGPLDPLVDWGHAYMDYVKRRFTNWRTNSKIEAVVNSCNDTIACCDSENLIFTNASQMIFVYDISRKKPHCVQVIKLETSKEVLSLDITKGHLIIRQGDAFAIYVKHKITFQLKGYLLRHEDCYVFTQHFYETNEGHGIIRYAVLEHGLSILVGYSLFMCNITGNIDIHSISVMDRSFFLHDHYRTYIVTGDKQITGLNIDIDFDDFDLPVESLIAMKSNKEIVVGLICMRNIYNFIAWDTRYGRRRSFMTHRPFGYEVHSKENIFAYVALDKFNLRVMLFIQDFEYGIKYEIDLDENSIAQAKLFFIGRDLLYVAIRCDWDIYDSYILVDLKTMKVLYQEYMEPTNVISVDSKHAVYCHGETIDVDTYLE